MKVIHLIFDPEKESKEAFEARKAGVIEDNVIVIVHEIVHPNINRKGARTCYADLAWKTGL